MFPFPIETHVQKRIFYLYRSDVTIISNLVFLIFDPDGNDITETIGTEFIQDALSQQLGGAFEIVINEDGDQEIGTGVSHGSGRH